MSTRERSTDTPRVPPVLPRLRIKVDHDGTLEMTLDGEPYDPSSGRTVLGRDAVRPIVDELVRRLGPIRVDLIESDGATFTDIITVPTLDRDEPPPSPIQAAPFEIAGEEYLPNESVALAVIISNHSPGADGVARIHLPPALLARHGGVVLFGRRSGAVTLVDPA